MEHSSDDVINIYFEDETEKHLPLRGGEGIVRSSPRDSNPAESSALVSEIKRVAKELGAQLDTTEDRKEKWPPEQHYDGGIDWIAVQTILATFGGVGGAVTAGWLFLRQCRPVLIKWLENKGARSITVEHITADNRQWKIYINGRNDLDELLETLQQYEIEEQEKRNTET